MYCKFYEAYKELAKSFHLIIDTREQLTQRYEDRIKAFKEFPLDGYDRQKLDVGDYSAVLRLPNDYILDFTDLVSVERKMSVDELLDCFAANHERFEAELSRAKNSGCKLFIATEEGNYTQLVSGAYKRKISIDQVLSTYHTFQMRYDVRFEWVTPDTFVKFTYETLRRYIYEYLASNFPNGEVLRNNFCI